MRILVGLAVVLLGLGNVGNAEDKSAAEPSPAAKTAEDALRDKIIENANAYVEAFNRQDAKSLAPFWTAQGEMVLPSGTKLAGRESIEKDLTTYFQEVPQAKLELTGIEVTVVSPSVIRETGISRVIVPDEEPADSLYEVIHVATPDGWKMDRVIEQAAPVPPPSHYQQLQSLEWTLGTWVDEDESASIVTTGRWTTNRNFIVRTFKVVLGDAIDFEGTQVIGWDPSLQVIRSWTFDSDGGFGVGQWTQQGDRWRVHTLSVLPDGGRASATHLYTLLDENTVEFKSIGREANGELLPSIGPVQIVRAAE